LEGLNDALMDIAKMAITHHYDNVFWPGRLGNHLSQLRNIITDLHFLAEWGKDRPRIPFECALAAGFLIAKGQIRMIQCSGQIFHQDPIAHRIRTRLQHSDETSGWAVWGHQTT